MRRLQLASVLLVALPTLAWSQAPATSEPTPVRITETVPSIEVIQNGQKIKVQRIQDPGFRLSDDYARTSRPCPPFCIVPMTAAPGVETYGELEVVQFMQQKANDGSGFMVDTRPVEFHKVETLPLSVNIPADIFGPTNPARAKIFEALGGKQIEGRWDFKQARPLVLWADGPWSDHAVRAIRMLTSSGYPVDRLKFYRGGMQDWKKLGLTTVIPPRKAPAP